ncbi:MAG: hypothetical protein JWQ38_3387 [Flavipsychrobacter sp.]|nr:hypothetical protein [Flavipsychrobacter sp.]
MEQHGCGNGCYPVAVEGVVAHVPVVCAHTYFCDAQAVYVCLHGSGATIHHEDDIAGDVVALAYGVRQRLGYGEVERNFRMIFLQATACSLCEVVWCDVDLDIAGEFAGVNEVQQGNGLRELAYAHHGVVFMAVHAQGVASFEMHYGHANIQMFCVDVGRYFVAQWTSRVYSGCAVFHGYG